jgi:hypothetical protein
MDSAEHIDVASIKPSPPGPMSGLGVIMSGAGRHTKEDCHDMPAVTLDTSLD